MNTKFILRFLIVWVLNSVLLLLANWLFPQDFVLGTADISKIIGGIWSGLLLTLICLFSKYLAKMVGLNIVGRYKKFVYYWIANSIGIWVVARLAPLSGFGISSFWWAIILGFTACLSQWLVRQVFKANGLLSK